MISASHVKDIMDVHTHHRMIFRAHNRGRSLRPTEIKRFGSYGVNALQLVTPWQVLGDRVVFDDKTFRFADHLGEAGESAFTIMLQSHEGLMDIVAWKPAEGRMALWTGDGFALGESHIGSKRTWETGLRIFRSPMDWLRADRRGIVIMRDDFAEHILQQIPILIADNCEHQRDLRDIFHGNAPEILVDETVPAFTAMSEVAA